jgi:hypothetical protein
MYALAYNLVRVTMGRAASRRDVVPDRVSFIDALRWLRGAEAGEAMPELVVNPWRPGRSEPRCKRRRADDAGDGRIDRRGGCGPVRRSLVPRGRRPLQSLCTAVPGLRCQRAGRSSPPQWPPRWPARVSARSARPSRCPQGIRCQAQQVGAGWECSGRGRRQEADSLRQSRYGREARRRCCQSGVNHWLPRCLCDVTQSAEFPPWPG